MKNNTHVAQTSSNAMSTTRGVYCCLVRQWEALRTCFSAFPITTKWCFDQDVKVVPGTTFTKRTCNRCDSLQKRSCCNFSAGVALKVWFSQAQYMKMTRGEHVIGFKSCDILLYCWIWMLSFLLKQVWIGIDFILLKFFAPFRSVLRQHITVTFGSVLGLQVTEGLQINSKLQPPTCWEPFVAGTMLHCPETTKERVEPTILSIIAIEIKHLTRFALLLQLRILNYMCRNHVATWA